MRLIGNVTIPKRPSSLGGIISWARGVNRTLQELRDRKIVGATRSLKSSYTPRPFCHVYQFEGNWKLLGGTVTGGAGVVTLADVTIGTIEPAPVDGTFYWLACDVTANEEDDVLLPGCELTAAAPGNGTSLPANTIPTISALSGQMNISLGEWMGGKFTPANCGNIEITHCPGSLSHTRV